MNTQQIEAQLKSLCSDVKENSLRVYVNHIKRIKNLLDIKSNDIEEIIKDAIAVSHVLEEYDLSVSVRRATIMLFKTLAEKLKLNDKIITAYKTLLQNTTQVFEEERMTNKVSQKNTDNWVSWDVVCSAWNKIQVTNKKTCMEKLIVGLYTRLNGYVLRLDFANMHVIDKSEIIMSNVENKNYIYYCEKLSRYTIVLNDYKTVKAYGRVTIAIYDNELTDLLNEWFSVYNTHPEWLLVTHLKPYSALNVTALSMRIPKIFKKYIGVAINNQVMRQIKESDTIYANKEQYDKLTLLEKKKIHSKLLHSFETAHQYSKILV